MTDREKLEKIKELADKMYSRMAYLTTDTRPIRQAMDEYHQFIINEYHKEETVRIKKGCKYRCLSDMQNTDTGAISFFKDKIYSAPEDGTLVSEENGWLCDISENSSNFELVEELASEDLNTAAKEYANNITEKIGYRLQLRRAVCFGANLQKQQMMAKAIDTEVKVDAGGYPYIPQIELYDYCEDIPLAKEGDKYKVVLIKEG